VTTKEIFQAGIYLFGAAVFLGAALSGIKRGQMPSIRGGRIRKKDGEVTYWLSVATYFALGAFLAVAAFVLT
jgi:hypothetical protein